MATCIDARHPTLSGRIQLRLPPSGEGGQNAEGWARLQRDETLRVQGPEGQPSVDIVSGDMDKALEIVFGVVMAILLTAFPIVIWRMAVLGPYRAARQLLERLADEVRGLEVVNANTDSRGEPGPLSFNAAWPIARGRRGAFGVELATQQGYKPNRPDWIPGQIDCCCGVALMR